MVRLLLHWFERHRLTFMVGMTAMGLLDLMFWDGWVTFYPMLLWGAVFTVHFFVYKSFTVDDQWADDRVLLDVYKPWDAAHVEEIRRNPWGKSPHRTDVGEDGASETSHKKPE